MCVVWVTRGWLVWVCGVRGGWWCVCVGSLGVAGVCVWVVGGGW